MSIETATSLAQSIIKTTANCLDTTISSRMVVLKTVGTSIAPINDSLLDLKFYQDLVTSF